MPVLLLYNIYNNKNIYTLCILHTIMESKLKIKNIEKQVKKNIDFIKQNTNSIEQHGNTISKLESNVIEILKKQEIDEKKIHQNEMSIKRLKINIEEIKGRGLKTFRIYAKRLFLSYYNSMLTSQQVLMQLKQKFPSISEYVIGEETIKKVENKEEEKKNIYVFLEFKNKINVYSAKTLEIIDKLGKKIEAKYLAVKDKNSIINFIRKNKTFFSSKETELDFELNLQAIALKEGIWQAMQYYCKQR